MRRGSGTWTLIPEGPWAHSCPVLGVLSCKMGTRFCVAGLPGAALEGDLGALCEGQSSRQVSPARGRVLLPGVKLAALQPPLDPRLSSASPMGRGAT